MHKRPLYLYLIRGLPGSGKSTLAMEIKNVQHYSTDDRFMVDGEYRFDPTKLGKAHSDTQYAVSECLDGGESATIANTFCERWEIEPYLKIAADAGARVVIIDTFDAGMTDEELAAKNVHGVPLATITAMRERWQHDWRKGNPVAPWNRRRK